MAKLLTILFLFFSVGGFSQKANAGSDVTIYLTQSSTATLDGSASTGSSFLWSDITNRIFNPLTPDEHHPTNTGSITSDASKITTVTGLSQGTWYYQIASKSGGRTVYDTMIIRVDYDVPPAGAELMRDFPIKLIAPVVNQRYDTTNYIGTSSVLPEGAVFFDRARLPGEYVDTLRGKFYSTLEDGYAWNGTDYDRSEVHFGSSFGIDSMKTYIFEWKGYFAQSIRDNMPQITGTPSRRVFSAMLAIMQWHGLGEYSPPFSIRVMHDNIQFLEWTGHGNGANAVTNIMPTDDDYVMATHTIRVTLKEGQGYPGQSAFIKVEVDGVQKYLRNTGQVGQTLQHDWPKFASLYDYRKTIVDPANHTRNKKFSLVTESFKIYTLNPR